MKAQAVKMLFVAFGALALLTGLGWLAYGGLLEIRGRSAMGVVVGHQRQESGSSDGDHAGVTTSPVFAPVVSFKTAEGRTIEFTSIEYLPREAHPLGQHVRVLYDPSAPQRAEIDSLETLWLMPAMCFGVGLTCVAGGFGAAWALRKMEEARETEEAAR